MHMCPTRAPDFNPRAPYGARHGIARLGAGGKRISIHAPHTGHDWRCRTDAPGTPRFQSTRPIRGTTSSWTRAGQPRPNFNPRAPYGARRGYRGGTHVHCRFQSTRPIRGTTSRTTTRPAISPAFQSTRPIRGTTKGLIRHVNLIKNFNPRAPYGARPSIRAGDSGPGYFNPRAPYGARHQDREHYQLSNQFQSTRPIRGTTTAISKGPSGQLDFNPRAPYGARLKCSRQIFSCINISIHAPHTGHDSVSGLMYTDSGAFQSTRPIRGTTAKMHNLCSAFLQQQTIKA